MKVLHLVTGLNRGGAETMLARLVGEGTRKGDEHGVLSLLEPGPVADDLRGHGVEAVGYGMRRGWPGMGALPWLAHQLRAQRPDVLQTWMYHADLLGSLVAPAAGVPLLWNVRQAGLLPGRNRLATRAIAGVLAAISGGSPSRIVCCSESALRWHRSLGYAPDRLVHIPNGYDSGAFSPDPGAPASVRAELDIGVGVPVLVHVARFHPQKDHAAFVEAVARLQARWPQLAVLMCGDGVVPGQPQLEAAIAATPRPGDFRLLGRRPDVARLFAAADLSALSSRIEGFPNVVVESLLCGTPCAVTDVGDAARLAGAEGEVVPPADPAALAAAMHRLLAAGPEERADRGRRGRERLASEFTLPAVYARYRELWAASARGG